MNLPMQLIRNNDTRSTRRNKLVATEVRFPFIAALLTN